MQMREVKNFYITTLMDIFRTLPKIIWDDQYENGRGTTLTDVFYRGRLDIVTSNWNGYHRFCFRRQQI